ncbi:NAD(P)/FAD-dependent oxidoreductase [Arachnia propionica]|uniref:NAD(P)/FAD-dependent oxidoreductase n=1 Tax=Arachnia propionica TaxID=1750 RepID=A0A3P1WN07_9ACTN|nr:NAD(P)/FAD-dependent oxidoreductase [Arachnia propionica]RRD47585.1 NAD(P)/FAD-dependent oxidoreductase [Arachnia propionica]
MSQHTATWDVIVAGGGAAGLSSALTLGRACRRVLVIDAGEPRNRFASHMHGLLGHEGLDPAELLERGRAEVVRHDVTLMPGAVTAVVEDATGLVVTLSDDSTHHCRALIAASGVVDELPDLPGLRDQWGRGVLHCPYCHGWELRGKRLAVVATSPMSLHQVELLRQWSADLVHVTGSEPDPHVMERLRSRGIRVIHAHPAAVLAEAGQLVGLKLDDGSRIELDAVFISPIPRPRDDYLEGLGLERRDYPAGSFLQFDPLTGATSHPRVWVAGNVANPPANVAVSIGAGAAAGMAANLALVAEDFRPLGERASG